jgi:hypothetical protein
MVGRRGSVLIEGVLTLGLLVLPTMGLNLELIRAAQYQAGLHHVGFLYTRFRTFGVEERAARRRAIGALTRAFGAKEARRWQRSVDTEFESHDGFGEGTVVYRYPGFHAYLHDRFQMTKRCRFSWSR